MLCDMDWLTPQQRSRNMAAIRSRGNKSTEKALRFRLVRYGVKGWRMWPDHLLGKPDFVFESARVAVFVDGCYWHGCPKCYRAPTSNTEYWSAKLLRNRARDRKVSRGLNRDGWKVLRFWEHQISAAPEAVVGKIREAVVSPRCAAFSATAGAS